ncbi:MAG: cell division protein ZapA [Magnetococcales bacterium]|nr:cell division protein ZapA [Magnetococcales bacterium]MBF0322404.1 cell division protein ZapA [Magnetococcales bacterium]
MSESVEVRIQGHVFRLKTDVGREYVHDLAVFVDETMKKMHRYSASSSVDRVAIMAALGIADTLFQLQKEGRVAGSEGSDLDAGFVERVQRLIVAADRLLEEE